MAETWAADQRALVADGAGFIESAPVDRRADGRSMVGVGGVGTRAECVAEGV
jgi:hypothetical protein